MNKGYNNETITAYLLGSLPEEKVEIFDELSFTDDDFADELKAAEKDLVDAYVNGELRGTTLEQFKQFYLDSPLRREKVEFAAAFQKFAANNVTEKIAAAEAKPEQNLSGFFTRFFTFARPSLQWSFALAALVLAIFGGWLFLENSRLRFDMNEAQAKRDEMMKRETELRQREQQLQSEIADQRTNDSETENELAKIREEREQLGQELKKSQQHVIEQKRLTEQQQQQQRRVEMQKPPAVSPSRQLIATFIFTAPLRGNSQLKTISVPAAADTIKARLELESSDYPAYRVVLQDQATGATLWQSKIIKAKTGGTDKAIDISFPAKLLKSKLYTLEVSGIAGGGTAEILSDYSFQVVP